ncbi:C45 family autoproteolytic acyltransferase/hydolase [Haloplanus halophilus]|uniref:C45 family autoproteolytic acyltransferase/hydolase n=1 Tax=Haloplanus halophilus TaxID=2949993 RepID=UPI00203EB9D5|nr:C45 family peptidase [Haloplanus sp. GDY1]
MSKQTDPSKYGPLRGLKLTGPPRERGITHGEAFADEIETNLEIYLDVFEHKGTDEATVYEQAEEFVPLIEDENEAYAEEMRGVAEGSGLSIEDVTILNARYEVMYSAFKQAADELNEDKPDACTAFGIRNSRSETGHTYLGQNWDWMPGLETFVMDVEPENGADHVAMTEAGIVGGKIGVNDAGLGMTVNGLITERDGEEPFRKPYHVRFREVLESERMDAAIEAVLVKDRVCSANVIVGHESGELIDLELAPERANYLYPDDGVLVHTNHVEDTSSMDSEFEKLLPDTLCRAPRLRRLLTEGTDRIDEATIRNALRDHFGHPNSICRHPDGDDHELDRLETGGSFVMDLTEKRLLGTNGPPCGHEYVEFQVGG